MATRWRKKPVEIEAEKFDGNAEKIRHWQYRHVQQGGHPSVWFADGPSKWGINVIPEGMDAAVYDYLHRTWVGVQIGDWIIKGVQGEFYPCKPDIFQASYEGVETEDPLARVADLAARYAAKGEGLESETGYHSWYSMAAKDIRKALDLTAETPLRPDLPPVADA